MSATYGRLADAPDWHLAALRRVPSGGTPECDALVDVASRPDLTDHDLECAIVHDRMLTRRLTLDAQEPTPMTTPTTTPLQDATEVALARHRHYFGIGAPVDHDQDGFWCDELGQIEADHGLERSETNALIEAVRAALLAEEIR